MNLHSSTGYAKPWTRASLFMPPVSIKHRKTTYLLKKEWMLAVLGGAHILVMAGKIWAPSSSECLYRNASALPVLGHSYYNTNSKALFPVFDVPLYLQVSQPPIRSSLAFSEFLSKRVLVKTHHRAMGHSHALPVLTPPPFYCSPYSRFLDCVTDAAAAVWRALLFKVNGFRFCLTRTGRAKSSVMKKKCPTPSPCAARCHQAYKVSLRLPFSKQPSTSALTTHW